MSRGRLGEVVPERGELPPQARQLLEVGIGQGLDLLGSPLGQTEAHDALVVRIGETLYEARRDSAVDELHGAVVAQQQMVGHVADGRRRSVAAHGEQQLMLRARQPHGLRLLLAPVEEAP